MPTFFQRLFTRPVASSSPDHAQTIARTAQITRSRDARALAKEHALDILDLTWEDTGRFKGSAVGPNISDMTIQVAHEGRVTCMPVIRYPNFSDRTADVAIDDIVLRVGNERGAALANVTLRQYLGNLRAYLSKPSAWGGRATSLLAPREKEVLVSAQACFLPVPKRERAEFNPVLFNYQSHAARRPCSRSSPRAKARAPRSSITRAMGSVREQPGASACSTTRTASARASPGRA